MLAEAGGFGLGAVIGWVASMYRPSFRPVALLVLLVSEVLLLGQAMGTTGAAKPAAIASAAVYLLAVTWYAIRRNAAAPRP